MSSEPSPSWLMTESSDSLDTVSIAFALSRHGSVDLPVACQLETGGHYSTLPVLHFLEPETGRLAGCCLPLPNTNKQCRKTPGAFLLPEPSRVCYSVWPAGASAFRRVWASCELGGLSSDYLQRTYSRKPTTLPFVTLQTVG